MPAPANPSEPKLEPLTKGPMVLRKWLNPVIDAINWLVAEVRKNKPREGKNVKITESPTGLKIDAQGDGSTAAPAACPLEVYRADDTHIGVRWGRINGRQGEAFHAGDDPPFTLVVGSGSEQYVYAYADSDFDYRRWVEAGVIIDDDPFLPNTSTRGYKLLGSFKVESGSITTVQSGCGDVTIDFCELQPDP